jgi:hypothetical protein
VQCLTVFVRTAGSQGGAHSIESVILFQLALCEVWQIPRLESQCSLVTMFVRRTTR